jgi:hypothetical protein
VTFEEYYTDAIGWGMNPAHRPAMLCAWDAALCAAADASRHRGTLKPALEIAAGISDLHSWVKPKAESGKQKAEI